MADALIKLPWGVITTVILAAITVGTTLARVEMLASSNEEMMKRVRTLEIKVNTNETELRIIEYKLSAGLDNSK